MDSYHLMGERMPTVAGYVPADQQRRKDEAFELMREALTEILDQIDYTSGNCRMNEAIGALLTKVEIQFARRALSAANDAEQP